MGARSSPVTAGWSPPRGARDPETGAFRYTLAGRPDDGWSSPTEREVAQRYAFLVGRLIDARYAADLSIREVGARTGISIATLTGIENGSSWPRLGTFQTAAGAVGRALTVRGDADVCGALRERIRSDHGSRTEGRPRLTYTRAAELATLQPNTVARLVTTPSPSVATVLTLAYALEVTVSLTGTQLRDSGAESPSG